MRWVLNIGMVMLWMMASGGIAQETNAPAAASTNSWSSPVDPATHVLNVQDRMVYAVEEDPVKLTEPDILVVSAGGETSFRVTRGSDIAITLKTRSKTLEQVRKELKERLDEEYYHDAHVRLELRDTAPKMGQVVFTGKGCRGNLLQIAPGEEKHIMEAIFQVGVTEFANLKKVKLIRGDPITGKPVTRVIDVEEIKRGIKTNNVVLQTGDIVEIPEKILVFQ